MEKKGSKKVESKNKKDKEKKENNSGAPVLQKKDRRIDDKEVQKYEEMLNKKTHRPKNNSKTHRPKNNSSKKK